MLSSQLIGEITAVNSEALTISILGIFTTNLFLIMLMLSVYKASDGKRT